jgi:dephospho-CoA kinase
LLIIAITGMPGAGKSTVAGAFARAGFSGIAMGDMIREETKRRKLPHDDQNMGMVMRELREKYGPGAVAELSLEAINSTKGDVVVVDGIRSIAEVEIFKRAGEVKLLAVLASPDRRLQLLKSRGRTDAPQNEEGFRKRDERELSIGVGGAIAMADEALSNEHVSPEELGSTALKVLDAWLKTLGR